MVYVAHEAVVYAVLRRSAVAHDDVGVGSGEPEGVDADGLQACNDLLVDQASVDHGDDFEHVGVGDATAAYHAGLQTQALGGLGGAAATAVHEHLTAGNGGKVAQQLGELGFVLDDGTAYFYKG